MRHEDLRCLQHGCETRAVEAEVKLVCSEEVWKKYLRFRDNSRVLGDRKNLMFCPVDECGQVIDRRLFNKKS